MSNIKKLLTLLITIAFISCGDGSYDFETTATYRADASNLTVNLTAIGHVFAGQDLGDGIVKASILSSKFSDTIYLQTSATKLTTLTYKKDTLEIIKPSDISMSLMHCLDIIGYSAYDKDEVKELGDVIKATAYGPKGTYMNGQTEVIKVLEVEFNYSN